MVWAGFEAALERTMRRAQRDQRGAILVWNLIMFILMLALIGFGWDLMRIEYQRARLQYNLDNATLAAADLDQVRTPSEVVLDYMEAAGLENYVNTDSIIADTSKVNAKTVYATATQPISSLFSGTAFELTDLTQYSIPAVSEAKESIDNLEISLVLDVSGSMAEYTTYENANGAIVENRDLTKIASLHQAAKSFVTQMINTTEPGMMSISIIPYARQVSMPPRLHDLMPHSDDHSISRCMNFDTADFSVSGFDLSGAREYEQTYWFSEYTGDDRRYWDNPRVVYSYNCQNETWRDMMLFQNDETTLHTYIDNLGANGSTSIDIGVLWGMALLDEGMNSIIEPLTRVVGGQDAIIPVDFANRPLDRTVEDSAKIMVVMTDGKNTSEYYIKDQFRIDDTGIFWHQGDEIYTQRDQTRYDSGLAAYRYYAEGFRNADEYMQTNGNPGGWHNEPYTDGKDPSVHLTFSEFASMTPLGTAKSRFTLAMPNMSSGKSPYARHNGRTKDNRTKAACDKAKSEGIQIYTIAFEASSDGEAVLNYCASSDSHYFDVKGLEISAAFSAIADSISKLRLTQ